MKFNNFTVGGGYDFSLSLIRLYSLLLIIICHMMQYYNFVLAWWFNVGVQIFLCLSGYLYGQRIIEKPVDFLHQRLEKILPPYYLTLIPIGIAKFLFTRESFSLMRFFAALLCRSTISGGGHLWFVPLILMCYLITPILSAYKVRYVKDAKSLWIFAVMTVFTVSLFFGLFAPYYNPAWVSCYAIGYMLGINSEKYISDKLLLVIISFFAFVGNGIQIYCSYVAGIQFEGLFNSLYDYFCNYNHTSFGLFLFLASRQAFAHIDFQKADNLTSILKLSDKYSYEAYVVHQFLILGSFSLMDVTPWFPVNAVLICMGIVIFAVLVKMAEPLVMKFVLAPIKSKFV